MVAVSGELRERFDRAATGAGATGDDVLEAFMRWYLREPPAEAPQRPSRGKLVIAERSEPDEWSWP
jgi:hypothetical protein